MKEVYRKYQQFTTGEFVLDDDFVAWVKEPDAEKKSFWEGFLEQHPHQTETVAEAKRLLIALQVQPEKALPATKDRIWKAVLEEGRVSTKVISLKRWWMAAAAVILIAAVTIVSLLSQGRTMTTVRTQYGEFKEVVLPDQSVVTLNGNSSLRYKKSWNKDKVREVWIDGEAFLNVKHLNQQGNPVKTYERFVVHAKEMDIEVLGTSFSVNVRQEKAKVILQSGKIELRFKDQQSPIEVKPGEKVEYTRNEKAVKNKMHPGELVLWKGGNLEFNSTPMKEVFDIMESDFGWHVVLPDSSVMNRTMTGSVSTENKEILLKALSIAMHLDIQKNGDTLIIQDQPSNQ